MEAASPFKLHRASPKSKFIQVLVFSAFGIVCFAAPLAACKAIATFPLLPGHDLIIDARINHADIPMIVDTGAGRTSVNEEIVENLDLPTNRVRSGFYTTIAGWIFAPNVMLGSLELGVIEFHDIRASVLDVPRRSDWKEKPKGILGADVLSKFDVDIDVSKRIMRLMRKGVCRDPFDGNFQQIRFKTNPTNEILFSGTLDDKTIRVLLDTGSTNGTLTEEIAQRVDPNEDATHLIGDAFGAGGRAALAHTHKFDQLKIGIETFHDVSLDVIDFHPSNVDMLLGLDYLRKRRVFISYSTQTIFIQRQEAPPPAHFVPSSPVLARLKAFMHPENADLDPDHDYSVGYTREIDARVWAQKFTPPKTPGGLVVVRFAFDRFGSLIFEKLAFKSQSDDLNQAALKMVRMAAPFPLPSGLEGDHVTLNVSIRFDPQ